MLPKSTTIVPKKKSIFLFWGLFVLLNLLLFLPDYLLNIDRAAFLTLPNSTSLKGWANWLLGRNNADVFRLSAEFGLITLILLLFKPSKWLKRLSAIGYLCLFYYHAYYAFSLKMFNQHPYFNNDFVLAKQILPVFLNESLDNAPFLLVISILALLMLSFTLWKILHKMFACLPNKALGNYHHWMHKIAGVLLLLFLLLPSGIYAFKKQYADKNKGLRWTTSLVKKSLFMPKGIDMSDDGKLQVYQEYVQKKLAQKPNIYLIAVESYGRIITQIPDVSPTYFNKMQAIETKLQNTGWHSTSAFSTSTIAGGRSWLAFTTLLTGLHINNQPQFNDLLNKETSYPHLTRYLKKQGYHTYRMKTMSNQKESTPISYALTDRFYEFDTWIKHKDLPYKGFQYEPMFGGIPDQFAMGYLQEEIVDPTQPLFLFFITMGSHGPWYPPPPVVADWRTLNQIKQNPLDSTRTDAYLKGTGQLRKRYERSIYYEMDFLTHFITQQADSNSIFILVGDHQPPNLTAGENFDTPIHVISQNKAFIAAFKTYGFEEGMRITKLKEKAAMKHEGFYSLLMRFLLQEYGEEGQTLPQYLPDGIK